MANNVLVVGSINVDVVIKVKNIPAPGETLHGDEPVFLQGGKGGNQAVSAAHNGADVFMISAVGSDQFGIDAIKSLNQYKVSTDAVQIKPGSTGTAYIYVDQNGENSIVVTAGANGQVDSQFVSQEIKKLGDSNSVVLAQMELPFPAVAQAATTASEIEARFILNLAPAANLDDTTLSICDPLVVNESEAEFLTGVKIQTAADAEKAVATLIQKTKSVIITLGAEGAVFSDGNKFGKLPSKKVQVVDTTGAGDAFCGALAAAFASKMSFESAVQAGLDAGANAVQHFGAQPPIN